ncbi:predicted protein [Sparassis crispa]|uniref:Fungal-type protein kinase domain-containing protein n=1 Tax=Sparassis crispa TaxID=139825 RepID=A0A401GQS6_9APHY|nr:predicted protein [Sparassis crispa]GBE84578.1 predicted protein [Sparassis crispa]
MPAVSNGFPDTFLATTPLAAKKESNHNHTNTALLYFRHAHNAKTIFLGPMPIRDFLGFLPETDTSRMPTAVDAFNDIPKDAQAMRDISIPLIAALNEGGTRKSRCPGFVFKDTTASGLDQAKSGFLNPDICCYANEVVDLVNIEKKTAGSLGYADLYINVALNSNLEFFTDPAPGVDRSSHNFIRDIDDERTRKHSQLALGRNLACAVEAFARQHRSFYFSISLSGSSARLIRWDRAGAIASQSFDLHEEPEPLCEFLWRYAHASIPLRGYDPTVEPANSNEEDLFKRAIERHVKLQLGLSDGKAVAIALEEHYQPNTVAVINMIGEDDVVRRLLVSRPVVSPLYMTGRGTRGYWAVTADGPVNEVVFLKDTWRCNVLGMKEGDILADLLDAGVPNITRLVHHRDVLEQLSVATMIDKDAPAYKDKNDDAEISLDASDSKNGGQSTRVTYLGLQYTQTNRYQNVDWVCKGGRQKFYLPSYVHYRLVVGTAGYGLQRFRGTEELLHATYDTYQAMMSAFNIEDPDRRRLHCDLSLSNVILYNDPNVNSNVRRGYLIDWELSCLVTEAERSSNQHKTGTFQYMSHRLLQSKNTHHTVQDDMESLFYAVLYCSLRYLPHDRKPEYLAAILERLFDAGFINNDGIRMGGDGKISNMVTRCYTGDVNFASPAIQSWLEEVMNFNADYALKRDTQSAKIWADPARFAVWWREFLDAHQLLRDDRFEHWLPPPPLPRGMMSYLSTSQSSVSHRSSSGTSWYGFETSPAMKRKAEDDPADTRALKRCIPAMHQA